MIVVTGVGRSGTSLIARIYEELGFDIGGVWVPSINAGLEAPDVVEANELLMAELGLFGSHRKVVPPGAKRRLKRYVPAERIEQVRGIVAKGPHLPQRKDLRLLRWERMDRVVHEHGARLRRLSTARPVVKDPRFRYTLEAWLRAGADIDHILVSLRDLDSAMKSKVAAGWEAGHADAELRNWLVYGFGLCMDSILTHRVDHNLVRFPDLLKEPDTLYEAMRFPSPVDRGTFLEAFERIARPDMVHH